jgi:hypothetical protein
MAGGVRPTPQEYVNAAMLCRMTGFSAQYLSVLQTQRIIKRSPNGKYTHPETICAIVMDLRARAKKGSAGARNKLAQLKAAELLQRIEIRAGALVPMEDAEEMVEKWAGAIRSELGSVPARVTRDLTMRRTIEHEINEALTRVTEIAAPPEREKLGSDSQED